MKRILRTSLAFCLIFAGIQRVQAQESEKELATEISAAKDIPTYSYNPRGRRDPFRDLLAGSDVGEEQAGKGIGQMSIDDIVLIGIVEIRDKLEAIINGPQGFPFAINKGDRFADGYVLSISPSKVVFRKTRQRGVALYRPRDITKEINPEEQ